ncbi:hypothetical protein I4Q36_04990 [Tuanshanicoccus lijuaniae]|uniref:hypothetical protein n=1 Tax=Aerococcaceae bacterium zg-1292 TaxID=2774330 RepID=UPI0019355FE5|nr:hypothetical protein [Aerococcaceae bacterium zg-1292]QQA38032.1 hypothetical protein I4Q36_04990 [Aerococcaceae bacterium zg-1292]
MKHQVVINVSKPSGEKTQVLKGAQLTLPKRFVRWLFGEYTHVFLMKPGQTIHSVDVKEVRKGEEYGENEVA